MMEKPSSVPALPPATSGEVKVVQYGGQQGTVFGVYKSDDDMVNDQARQRVMLMGGCSHGCANHRGLANYNHNHQDCSVFHDQPVSVPNPNVKMSKTPKLQASGSSASSSSSSSSSRIKAACISGLRKLTASGSGGVNSGHGPRKYGISDLSQISNREDTPPPGLNATDNAKFQHRVRGAPKDHGRSSAGFNFVITPLERQRTVRMNRDHALITRGYLGNGLYRHPRLRKKYGSSDDLLDEMRNSEARIDVNRPPSRPSYQQRVPALSRESPPPVCTCTCDPPVEPSTSRHNSSFEESLKRREAELHRRQSRSLHHLATGNNHSDPNLLHTDNASLEDSGYHDFEDLIAAAAVASHAPHQQDLQDIAYRNKLNECWNRIQRHRQQSTTAGRGGGGGGGAPAVGVSRKESSSSTGSSVSSTPSSSSASAKSSPPLAQSSARTSPNGSALQDGPGLVTIRMKPDSQGRFGFNVKGGADQKMPIIVSRVAPATPADICIPRLNEGDQVLYINGRDVSTHSHEQVVMFIRASRETHSGELVLIVRPNVYIGEEPPDEPDFQYIPDTHQISSTLPPGGDPLDGSMMLLTEGLHSGAALAQFEQLYRKKTGLTMNAARLSENIPRNRYRDISPYDQTRVKIKGHSGDYINANFVNMEIPGSGIINRYIAAQGPLPNTCCDFWTMVWEQQCTLVVMLTTNVERGRVKCHQYWPDLYETTEFSSGGGASLQLTCLREENTPSFAFREFTLVNNKDSSAERHITHMQYNAWPDHGVPDDSGDFLQFVHRVRSRRAGMGEPTVVHCSAGIGRTGVLITMETAMCLIEANQPVYPLDIVRQERDQRAMLIQTSSQYKFVCEAILRVYNEKIVQPLDDYKR